METIEDAPENPDKQDSQKPKNPHNRFRMDPKEEREKRKRRRARVIVRNISYKATEESLRNHFKQFGKIAELNLLKRPDGKLVGCAFVQFEEVNEAAKAILQATKKEFLGRPVYVDWAVGKDEYVKRKSLQGKSAKEGSKDNAEVKEEEMEVDGEGDGADESEIKSEEESGRQSGSDGDEDDSEQEDEDNSGDSATDKDGDDDEVHSNIQSEDEDVKTKPKRASNDVNEGCTIFIKNVPFDATDDDLRKCCQQFGALHYALINKDPVSGHSKGTGFVKFKSKDSADLCLSAGEEFVLLDSILDPLLALSREEIRRQKNVEKQKDPSDSRNLYLVKEGLIMSGSKAAEGVSASDMNKRHKLEQTKTQILKNLNRFVSRNRLSIHNLPMHYDDEKLRNMVTRFTGMKPHECRVMRENKSSVGNPRGKPKGFGFVSFKTHVDALGALRKLNNNPKVFNPNSRPIVGFSIEDRSVHKIKERRVQKSREANPTYKEKLEKLKAKKSKKKSETKDDKAKTKKGENGPKKVQRNAQTNSDTNEESFENFVGMAAKTGTIVKMRSGRKIKEQAQVHMKRVSEQKRKEKKRKEQRLHRIEKKQIDRPKKGKKKPEKDNFSLLVNKYKQLLDSRNKATSGGESTPRTKWYAD